MPLQYFTTPLDLTGVTVPSPRDVADEMVLATFVAADAEWLGSGDETLLVLADQSPILSPAAFVARFLS